MAGLREKILEAAESILGSGGPAEISTRAIAKVAGCSDGALYKHFESLDEVLLELFKEKLPTFKALQELPLVVGKRTVEENLAGVLATGLEFIRAAMPIWIALWSDEALRRAYYERLKEQGGGPHVAILAISAYLEAEQRLGRVNPDANVATSASLVLAATMQRGTMEKAFKHGWKPTTPMEPLNDRDWARATAAALVVGLRPVVAASRAPRPRAPRPRRG
jgi:AcrR family transcriptional regulator